jgi:hypothetical protein
MSFRDIAEVSGLDRSSVIRISRRTTWRGMNIDVIQKFSLACGVNLANGNHSTRRFIRRGLKSLLRYSSQGQQKTLRRGMAELSSV